ncbi:MAG: hypothetical protein L0215_14020 [Gemmataceae bacterium]|nr:hypothetical protein [Gemmataceae bacterium]
MLALFCVLWTDLVSYPQTQIVEGAERMVTVHDVFYYLQAGRSPKEIREILRLSEEQITLDLQYIQENRQEVEAVYEKVEERIAKGNPVEIEAKRRASRAKTEAWLKERRSAGKVVGERHSGRQ